jgi:hypothetical protein
MTEYIDNISGAMASYFIAAFALLQTQELIVVLGSLALVVRLTHDTLRLIRYMKNPDKYADNKGE